MKKVIAQLLKLADDLDGKGAYEEADMVTDVVQEASSLENDVSELDQTITDINSLAEQVVNSGDNESADVLSKISDWLVELKSLRAAAELSSPGEPQVPNVDGVMPPEEQGTEQNAAEVFEENAIALEEAEGAEKTEETEEAEEGSENETLGEEAVETQNVPEMLTTDETPEGTVDVTIDVSGDRAPEEIAQILREVADALDTEGMHVEADQASEPLQYDIGSALEAGRFIPEEELLRWADLFDEKGKHKIANACASLLKTSLIKSGN